MGRAIVSFNWKKMALILLKWHLALQNLDSAALFNQYLTVDMAAKLGESKNNDFLICSGSKYLGIRLRPESNKNIRLLW